MDRTLAYCSRQSPEVFQSVALPQQIWTPDPFDVAEIHADAREVFHRMLDRATNPHDPAGGQVLLLKGEAGCGKTHLMRAFRNSVHTQGSGYVGYMQMTTLARNYPHYMLANLIDSLDKPYSTASGTLSGLRRLSDSICEHQQLIPFDALMRLREMDFTAQGLGHEVRTLADRLIAHADFAEIDLDLLRALLYLQRDDPRIKSRVMRYLRCHDLAEHDRVFVGGLVPRSGAEDAAVMLRDLGTLVARVGSGSLVLCIDQLEDLYNLDESGRVFHQILSAINDLVGRTPGCMVVIACLEDYYTLMRKGLPRTLLDRIESSPEPIVLSNARSLVEVECMVAKRLDHLYESMGAPLDEKDVTFPFTQAELAQLANQRSRDVLAWCREHHESCVAAGQLRALPATVAHVVSSAPVPVDGQPSNFDQSWSELLSSSDHHVPDDDLQLLELLTWALGSCNRELGGDSLRTARSGPWTTVDRVTEGRVVDSMLLGLCNSKAQGGGLGRQVSALSAKCGSRRPVLLRCTSFPLAPRTAVAQQIGELVAAGGRRVLAEDSDWRAFVAMRQFESKHTAAPGFALWRSTTKPLLRLPCLSGALGMDPETLKSAPLPLAPPVERKVEPASNGPRPRLSASTSPAAHTNEIVIGQRNDLSAGDVRLAVSSLTRHAAFIGASGSGKTTLALNVVESLLEQGIPVLLIDRKGDLCSYADAEAWSAPAPSHAAAARRDALRKGIEVAVYTPGAPAGRNLSISIAPDDLGSLPAHEREQQARQAAAALGEMLGLRARSRKDEQARVLLGKAIEVLAAYQPDRPMTLEALLDFVGKKDPTLVAAIGALDAKGFDRLAEDLQTLLLRNGGLFANDGERLDVVELLGLGRRGPRPRLSILSTKFLGDDANVLFWIARLLSSIGQQLSKHPADGLQAVLMLDEADIYLPASSKPATKEPMENLLKRARSAGLGVFLSTQNPGDLDYRCRDNISTWFVGSVRGQTSLNKLGPLLERHKGVMERIPAQGPGEFYLLTSESALAMRAARNLVPASQLSEGAILSAAGLRRRLAA